MDSPYWQKYVYQYVFFGCGLLVLLTVAAMFTYPGGLFTGELTSNYDFFRNFLSVLGRITVKGKGQIPFRRSYSSLPSLSQGSD